MPGRYRLGLLGCGLWGTNILRELLSLGCPVLVADPDPQARLRARTMGATQTAGTALELRVDAWLVATPASSHEDLLGSLLATGRPIFCEKPFTLSAQSAARLAHLGHGRLCVGHVWRYHPGVERLAQLLARGELGPLRRIHSLRVNGPSPRTDVDAVWTLAPHDLSILLELLGDLPEAHSAAAERHDARPAGLVACLGEDGPDAPLCSIEVSTRYAVKRRELRLHCEDGVACFDGVSQRIELWHRDADAAEIPTLDTTPALRRELAAFLAFLDGGALPRSSAADAARIVERLCQLRQLAGLDT